METTAKARYLRVSPKKVRLVIDVVRGMDVDEALTNLANMKKSARHHVIKLLNSAIANAEHNHELKRENLYIKKISADGGPIINRWRPRAHGRAGAIRKRTTHLSVTIAEREPAKENKKAKPQSKPVEKVGGRAKKQKAEKSLKKSVADSNKEKISEKSKGKDDKKENKKK
jgi:large subunit ribosomal protein L22